MGWSQPHRPNPARQARRLIGAAERNARIAQAAEQFAAAEAELHAADAAWPDAMGRTALLDIDQPDIERIQERCRVATREWAAAKAVLLAEVNR